MIWVWRNSISIACIFEALALAWRNTEGWGWFLFVAVLAGVKPGENYKEEVRDV